MDMENISSRYRHNRSIALRSIAEEMGRDLGKMSEAEVDVMLKDFEEKKSKEM